MSSTPTASWINGFWVFFCTTFGASVFVWNETIALEQVRKEHIYSTLGDEVWTVGALLMGAFCGCAAGICIAFLARWGKGLYVNFLRARSA